MKKILALLPIAVPFFTASGCAGTLDDEARFLVDAGVDAPPAMTATCGDVPTTILAATCTPGCHDATTKYQNLDLASPGVASRLVGVHATEGAGYLIDTGNPANSAIYTKCTSTPPFGLRMPQGLTPLDDTKMSCLLSWVTTEAMGSMGTNPDSGSGSSSGGGDSSVPPPSDASPPAFTPIRVACGETSDVMDSSNNTWSKDMGYTGGLGLVDSPAKTIANTTSQVLYNNERYGADSTGAATSFSYSFTVPTGAYTVTLKFAEVYATMVGQRQFNVAINGAAVETNLDIFAVAGANTALDRSYPVMVSGGTIKIDFSPGAAQSPKVDDIEIVAGTVAADN